MNENETLDLYEAIVLRKNVEQLQQEYALSFIEQEVPHGQIDRIIHNFTGENKCFSELNLPINQRQENVDVYSLGWFNSDIEKYYDY